jgi:GNAT superfamily N-acetyltransferase
MSDVTVRPLRGEDHAEWRRLWTLYLEYYESSVPEEVYETTFERLLSGGEHEFHGLIAELDGKPVGLTHYVFHRSTWQVANVCYLEDLYVDESVRGKSIGRALIEAVYAAADEAGNPDVYWLTQHFNATGRRLYDRVGELSVFVRYDRPG